MRGIGGFLLLLFAWVTFAPARAGHEPPIYPSYYPQEIRIEAVTPEAAARRLGESGIHAYVGAPPAFAGPAAKSLRAVESLGAYVVARFNPDSPRARGGEADCAALAAVVAALSGKARVFVFHPYPVTPFHPDYLYHADRVEAARAQRAGGTGDNGELVVAVGESLAEEIGSDAWPRIVPGTVPDIVVEAVSLASLLAPRRTSFDGWLGPLWFKEGWYHASLLLAPGLGAGPDRDRITALVRRLTSGAAGDAVARVNAERDLVRALTGGCRVAVAGYTLRREYYNADYSHGVESVGHDSLDGLNAPIFIRTVKLKDFPWNGWLRLGVPAAPDAAWNPVGGFTDDAGRLIWSAIGDPAAFPEPHGLGWILNRIGDVKAEGGQ